MLSYEFVAHTMLDLTEVWLSVVKFDLLNEALKACFNGNIVIGYNLSFKEITYIQRLKHKAYY